MRNFIAGIVATAAFAVLVIVVIWFAVLPHLNWGADHTPPAIETVLARNVIGRWARANAQAAANPLLPTAENLRAARSEYEDHCAACHGLDGSGRNQFEAQFYPPVAKLTGAARKLSDSEIYFIVAKGIGNTAMPAFGRSHSAEDVWRLVLWVRHLVHLTPKEHAAIEQQMQQAKVRHESTMELRGAGHEPMQ